MKKISILGSTGSIGTQALDIIRNNPGKFAATALTAHSNIDLLEKQIAEFKPEIAVITDETAAGKLRARYTGKARLLSGIAALEEAAVLEDCDLVLTAMVGFAGLKPTLSALSAGKNIALANKETLVAAGKIVTRAARAGNCRILPVDSEHSAIFQCLNGEPREALRKIILTASGGPFFGKTSAELARVAPEDALKHPNWNMGTKITIDSATLANKALEMIEACWLFDVSIENVEVVVHRQSIVHSMVEFQDNSIIAQLGLPDMRLPIQYAFTYPQRTLAHYPATSIFDLPPLTFEKPDLDTFRCLRLAIQSAHDGGIMPCVFNAANEIAVAAFLERRLGFNDIPAVIAAVLDETENMPDEDIGNIFSADSNARDSAKKIIAKVNGVR